MSCTAQSSTQCHVDVTCKMLGFPSKKKELIT